MDGYLFQFGVYQGKHEALPKHFGLGKKVVHRMTKHFMEKKNHYCNKSIVIGTFYQCILLNTSHLRRLICVAQF